MKPGEEAVSVNVAWTVEKFVEAENGKKNGSVKKAAAPKGKEERGKKATPAKKAKVPAKAKKPTAKKPAGKAKKAPAKKKK